MNTNKRNYNIDQEIDPDLSLFIDRICPPGAGFIEFRPIGEGKASGKIKWEGRTWLDPEKAKEKSSSYIEYCREHSQGAFFGVLPRPFQGASKKTQISGGFTCWIDIDDKDTGSRKKTLDNIASLPFQPSAIVVSGGGVHVYYFLDRCYSADRIEKVNKLLLQAANGDNSAWNRDRILRLPGSFHKKGEEFKTFFQHIEDVVFELEILEETIPQKKGDLLELMLKHPKIQDYYEGRGKIQGDKSPSAYDWIFCKEAFFYGASEEEVTKKLQERILRDDRKKPSGYVKRTIDNALRQIGSSRGTKNVPREQKIHPLLELFPDDFYRKDKRGKPKNTLINCFSIVEMLGIQGDLKFNKFKNIIEYKSKKIADHHLTTIRLDISRQYKVEFPVDMVTNCIDLVARKHEYHPVTQWLDLQEWDNKKRLNPDSGLGWLGEYCELDLSDDKKEEFADLIKEIGKCWLISCVARVKNPGCKVDSSLILLGGQGVGKSTLFSTLAVKKEWFSCTALNLKGGGNKDTFSKLQGKWIYEFAEMATTRKRDSETVKSFLSSTTDSYRPPWGRYDIDQPRQVVFCGTSNELEVLRDSSGDRRYWVLPVKKIHLDRVKRDLSLLWAEAVFLYDEGEGHDWHLSKHNEGELVKLQAPYKESDSWLESIEHYLYDICTTTEKKSFTMKKLLTEVLNIPTAQQNRGMMMRVAGLLSGANWTKKREHCPVLGRVVSAWYPPKKKEVE